MSICHYRELEIILVALVTTSYVIVVSEGCYNPPPGISRMVRGVDITQLDLLPVDATAFNGFKSPVINFTCHENRTWRSPRGGDYQLPDQLWHMNSLSGAWLYADVEIYRSYKDVKRTITRNVGGEFSFWKLGFSASKTSKDMQNTIVNNSRVIADVGAYDSATRADFLPSWRLHLDEFAQEYVDTMLGASFEADPAAYNKFIQQFGTHYFDSAKYGGYMRVVHEIDSNYVKTVNEKTVETQAKASFLGIISAHGGRVSGSTVVDSRFRQATTVSTRYYGGYTNLLADNGIQQWQPTVYNDPWLFSGILKPISDLIRNGTKKNSMITAINTHILKSYLDELTRLLDAIKNPDSVAASHKTSLLSRLSTMKERTVLTELEVTAIGLETDGLVQAVIPAHSYYIPPTPRG